MRYLYLLPLILVLIACEKKDGENTEEPVNSKYVVNFLERDINLEPYFEGFPFMNFTASYKGDKLFYYHQDSITMMKMVDLNNIENLESGEMLSDIDFSLRNIFSIKYNEKDNSLYWSGDEKNDEKIDLFRMNLEDKKIEKLTDVPYIFGWSFNDDKTKIAYVVRMGHLDKRLGELRVLDLKTGDSELIMHDSEDFRFTWGTPSWSPDGKHVALPALKEANRTFANVMLVNLEEKKGKVITDDTKARYFPGILDRWFDGGNKFIYTSDEGGYTNLYSYDITTRKNNKVTNYTEDLGGAEPIEFGENSVYLAVITSNPVENNVHLIDPLTGDELFSKTFPYNISVLDAKDNKLLVSEQSNTIKFKIEEMTFTQEVVTTNTKLELPEELNEKIVQANVRKIEYETFDTDKNTGEKRKIHAFLYEPKNPLPKEQQMVMIQSFYGGKNSYNVREHILAEAGVYVLSPSPRGSSGFGKEFYALNDKDLGGNEIIDIMYAARYVSEELGIPPERIGVFGGSHGGYATMRLLTFPGEVNGIEEDFSFGFGIAHAGFSDIINFYENCNIPDWVTLEAGDPETESEKLKDRSPLYDAASMEGKLLLTHGSNDSRVPIEGSKFMYDSLKKYQKEVIFEEYENMGHHIKGLDNNVRQYKTWFEFLESVVK